MKGSMIALSLAAFLVLSFTEIHADVFDELCEIPETTRNILLECVIDAFDARSKRDMQRLEECAGHDMLDTIKSICSNPDLDVIQKFADCENELGISEPNIDQAKAQRCARRRLS
uniref:Venom peptide HtTxA2 n=1 Tax=Hadogenes troglodytes TaxID=1577150 RepID=A0A1B3IJ21_9SCOR|nr:venom peptide HtTxA2 [Hadogenes troglodytes]